MKKNIKFIFAYLSFLFIAMCGLWAQAQRKSAAYDDLYFYAQNLYSAGAYEEAQTEFKRYIFMQDYAQGNYLTESFCTLAEIYEKNQQWDLAAQTIQKAINSLDLTDENPQVLDSLRLTHIRYIYNSAKNSKKYLSDDLYIFTYMNLPDVSDTVKQCAYSAAIANAIINGRIEYAQKTIDKAMELFPQGWTQEERQIIISNFEKLAAFKPKNQRLAGYLSFIPGLGQLYAANYTDSLNAFLLNGSIIAVSVYSICTFDFWTFSLLEFNPLIRFMKGNIYNAQKDAYQYNLKKQNELAGPILECLGH